MAETLEYVPDTGSRVGDRNPSVGIGEEGCAGLPLRCREDLRRRDDHGFQGGEAAQFDLNVLIGKRDGIVCLDRRRRQLRRCPGIHHGNHHCHGTQHALGGTRSYHSSQAIALASNEGSKMMAAGVYARFAFVYHPDGAIASFHGTLQRSAHHEGCVHREIRRAGSPEIRRPARSGAGPARWWSTWRRASTAPIGRCASATTSRPSSRVVLGRDFSGVVSDGRRRRRPQGRRCGVRRARCRARGRLLRRSSPERLDHRQKARRPVARERGRAGAHRPDRAGLGRRHAEAPARRDDPDPGRGRRRRELRDPARQALGARVITTTSAGNVDYVRGLGADEVIDDGKGISPRW